MPSQALVPSLSVAFARVQRGNDSAVPAVAGRIGIRLVRGGRSCDNSPGLRAVLPAAIVVLLCGMLPPAVAQPQPNSTQAENAKAGTNAWQRTQYDGVQLYADQIGALPGDAVGVHVNTDYRYRLRVYRLGWYGGAGARLLACVPSCSGDEPPTVQRHYPAGGDSPQRASWSRTDVVQTEADWPSGYYAIEAELTSGSVFGRIGATYLIVRQPAGQQPSQLLV